MRDTVLSATDDKLAELKSQLVGLPAMVNLGSNGWMGAVVADLKADVDEDGNPIAFTFACVRECPVTRRFHSSNSRPIWPECELRNWLNGAFFDACPAELRNAITPAKKKYYTTYGGTAVEECVDKFWIPSLHEISYGSTFPDEGTTYQWFTEDHTRPEEKSSAGVSATRRYRMRWTKSDSCCSWWVRSWSRYGSSPEAMSTSASTLSGGSNAPTATTAIGIVPCFCI